MQVRRYDSLIEKKKSKKKKIEKQEQPKVWIDGFGYCTQYTKEEYLEFCKQRNYRVAKSVSETRKRVYNKARSVGSWKYFLTFSFKNDLPNLDRTDYKRTSSCVCQFLKNQRRQEGNSELKYIVLGERHVRVEENGKRAYHYHALVADCSFRMTDSGRVSFKGKTYKKSYLKKKGIDVESLKTIYNLDGFRWGYTTCIEIGETEEDVLRMTKYVLKYLCKDLLDSFQGKREKRFFASRNIPAPVEEIFNVKSDMMDAFIENILKENLKEVSHTRKTNKYIKTTIYETKDI